MRAFELGVDLIRRCCEGGRIDFMAQRDFVWTTRYFFSTNEALPIKKYIEGKEDVVALLNIEIVNTEGKYNRWRIKEQKILGIPTSDEPYNLAIRYWHDYAEENVDVKEIIGSVKEYIIGSRSALYISNVTFMGRINFYIGSIVKPGFGFGFMV